MRRTTTSLSLTLLTLAVLAGVLAATPASGQVEAEIEALEVRRDEIGIELDQIDTDLALTEAELEVLDRERVTAEVQIELTADDLERAVDSVASQPRPRGNRTRRLHPGRPARMPSSTRYSPFRVPTRTPALASSTRR